MLRKEWLKGTPIYPEKDRIRIRSIVDYSLIELNPEPTLLNKRMTKNLEILWCSSAEINPICSTEGHMLVIIEKNGNQEIGHVFRPQVIQFINDHSQQEEEYQLVIKTRIPFADPGAFFHEIRYIEPI